MAGDNTLNFTDGSFDQEVLKSDVPVLVDFWAPWCGPCKAMTPTIDAVAKEYVGKIKIGKCVGKIMLALLERRAQDEHINRRRGGVPPRRERGLRAAEKTRIGIAAAAFDAAARELARERNILRIGGEARAKLMNLVRGRIKRGRAQRFQNVAAVLRNERFGKQ